MPHNGIRALTGLVSVAVIAAIVAVAVGLFRGSFTDTTPVTVLSPRAGLVMNPDAKVKMHGVQVGKVASIESRPDGQAVLRLAMYPSEMHLIPANVLVDLTSPTVFGAKFVELVAPAEPSAQSLHAGQVLDSQHVTVEVNTVFKHLTSVLGTLDPAKLNETLGAISQALSGRGEKIGQAFSDLDSFLAKFDPSLPALSRDIALSVPVFHAYGDASADLVRTVDNSVKISKSIVDEQHNLDAFLVSAIGLADIGNDVLGANRKGLTDVFHLLAPTTDLLSEYAPGPDMRLRRNRSAREDSAVVGTEHQYRGESHVGRRTLSVSAEPAQGCGDGRPALHGSSEAPLQQQGETSRRRYRCQPGAVRESAVAAQLRWPQTAVVWAD